jgi:energy-converting hydrogenase Eha subunit C
MKPLRGELNWMSPAGFCCSLGGAAIILVSFPLNMSQLFFILYRNQV